MKSAATRRDTSTSAIAMPAREEIAARAYQLWEARGRVHGHHVDDWLQAEYELLQLPIRKLAEIPTVPETTGKHRRKSLVSLVQTALFAGVIGVSSRLP